MNYLREQATQFRDRAVQEPEADEATLRELKELAETCEEVAAEWEAKHPAG
ncbi:hypothetical protein [Rhodovastum atsumiense]|uniref:hypothetical protein n=1 Tax=Rhodovastum atsumiense TaxID=504468 RepID=UPI00139F2965|nr:hypothetical protein [Rhodovastum atsumiense]